jgi:hypothetical protein
MTAEAADLPAVDVDTTDAMAWAKAFCARVRTGLDATDEGWLVGWFANAMAAQERADRAARPPGDAATDALADLADALVGIRTLVERAMDHEEKREADEAADSARRKPAEWEQALRSVEEWLNAQHVEGSTGDPVRGPTSTSVPLVGTDTARKIIEALDRHLRADRYVSLRYSLRTLAGSHPPNDLRAEAEAWAKVQYGTLDNGSDLRAAAVKAYLTGAGVHE